jgi:hypothetical protein
MKLPSAVAGWREPLPVCGDGDGADEELFCVPAQAEREAAFEDNAIAIVKDAEYLADLRLVEMIRGIPLLPQTRTDGQNLSDSRAESNAVRAGSFDPLSARRRNVAGRAAAARIGAAGATTAISRSGCARGRSPASAGSGPMARSSTRRILSFGFTSAARRKVLTR